MPYAHSNICSRLKYSKPSTTSEARHALVQYFTENYPLVKRLKIKDHKRFFVARARYGQRVLYAKAYSLERLTEYFRQEFEVKVFGKLYGADRHQIYRSARRGRLYRKRQPN